MSLHLDLAVLAIAVKAEDDVPKDLGDVHRDIKSANDPGVPIRQAVLDVVQRGVDEHALIIPGSRLDADRLMHRGSVAQLLVCNDDRVLAQQRHLSKGSCAVRVLTQGVSASM